MVDLSPKSKLMLVVKASFCYLGDMLSTGGGSALAIATRCSTAWGKFRIERPLEVHLAPGHNSQTERSQL